MKSQKRIRRFSSGPTRFPIHFFSTCGKNTTAGSVNRCYRTTKLLNPMAVAICIPYFLVNALPWQRITLSKTFRIDRQDLRHFSFMPYDHLFPSSLVDQAMQGDKAALNTLFINAQKFFHTRVCQLKAKGQFLMLDTDDLVQEVTIHVSERLYLFQGGNFGGWLNTLMKRKILDIYRKAKKFEKNLSLDQQSVPSPGDAKLNLLSMLAGEDGRQTQNLASLKDWVRSALDSFFKEQPNVLREKIVRMYYLEGLNYDEISSTLDITKYQAGQATSKFRIACKKWLLEKDPQ